MEANEVATVDSACIEKVAADMAQYMETSSNPIDGLIWAVLNEEERSDWSQSNWTKLGAGPECSLRRLVGTWTAEYSLPACWTRIRALWMSLRLYLIEHRRALEQKGRYGTDFLSIVLPPRAAVDGRGACVSLSATRWYDMLMAVCKHEDPICGHVMQRLIICYNVVSALSGCVISQLEDEMSFVTRFDADLSSYLLFCDIDASSLDPIDLGVVLGGLERRVTGHTYVLVDMMRTARDRKSPVVYDSKHCASGLPEFCEDAALSFMAGGADEPVAGLLRPFGWRVE